MEHLLIAGGKVEVRFLCDACEKGNIEIVRLLLQYPEGVRSILLHYGDKTPLYLACRSGKKEIVRLLLEYPEGVKTISAVNGEYDLTSLHIACMFDYIEIVAMLLQHPKDVQIILDHDFDGSISNFQCENMEVAMMFATYLPPRSKAIISMEQANYNSEPEIEYTDDYDCCSDNENIKNSSLRS